MTKWYIPAPCYQFDGSKCAGSNCWACAGVVQLDAATAGAARITPTTFRQRAGGGSGSAAKGDCASGFEVDVLEGLRAMGVRRSSIIKVTRSKARAILTTAGSACFTIATDYELWPQGKKCDAPSFDGNHAIVVFRGADSKGRVLIANSVCRELQWVPLPDVLDAAMKFSTDKARGGLIHMVRVFRPVVPEKDQSPAELELAKALDTIERKDALLDQARELVAALTDALADDKEVL